MTEHLLTTAETCTQLRISRTTLWRLTQAGRFRPIRITARHTRYRQAEIDEFIEAVTDDDAATIRDALTFLQERHAEEHRPLCPACGKRRVNRGASICTWCQQQHETQLLHKRNWWDAHGAANRDHQRQETASG